MTSALVRSLLPGNLILIAAYTSVGILQWVFLKLVALAQAPAEFGRFVAVSFLGLILVAPLVTLQGGVSRQVAQLVSAGRSDAVATYLRRLLRRWLGPVIAIGGALLLVADPLARSLELERGDVIRWLVAVLVLDLPFHLVLGALAGRDRLRTLATILLLEVTLRCGVALLVPGWIVDAAGALSLHAGALAIATTIGLILVRRDFGAGSEEDSAPVDLPPVLPSFLLGAAILFTLAFQDALLVRLILGNVEAAHYGAAVALSRLVHVLPLPMFPILVPRVTRLRHEGRPTLPILLYHLVLLGVPCAGAVTVGWLLPGLVGGLLLDPEKYGDLGVLLPLAFATASFHAMTNLTMHYLLALRRKAVLIALPAAAGASVAIVLTSPPDPTTVLGRLLILAATTFAVALVLVARDARGEAS